MDGYELSKQIRSLDENYRDIPIIAMTADVLNDQRQRCLDAGMNDLLAKPIRLDDLSNMFNVWGVLNRNGLKLDTLINIFGQKEVLLSFLQASVKSLYDALLMPLSISERADWVHRQAGTIAILGLAELSEYGWSIEIELRNSNAEEGFLDFRAKLYIAMKQMECALNLLRQEVPDLSKE